MKQGVAHTAANVDQSWIGTDVDAGLDARIPGTVETLNDADAAGIAEMRYGAGRDRGGVVLMLTFGTGIGSALFVDGAPGAQHRVRPHPGRRRGRRAPRRRVGPRARGAELPRVGRAGWTATSTSWRPASGPT